MVRGALLALTALTMVACEPQGANAPQGDVIPSAKVFASASLGPFDGHINALSFAPVSTVPWEGRLIIAPSAGGLGVIDVEGQQDSAWEGETFVSLAAQPDFNLRGLNASLLLTLNSDGALRSFIIDDARGQVIEAPVSGLAGSNVTAICAVQPHNKAPAFLIAQADKSLAVWTISDTGDAALRAQKTQTGKLAIVLHACAVSNNNAVAIGEKGGLFTLSLEDGVRMISGVESTVGQITALTSNAKNLVLVSNPAEGNLHVYDDQLQSLYTLNAPKALSTPGAAEPGALAVSTHSFGGSGFSAGLMAVADDSTNRIALVVLDTVPVNGDTPES